MATEDMLCDSMTKHMRDRLIVLLMRTGGWLPSNPDYKDYVVADNFFVDTEERCRILNCGCRQQDESVVKN